MSSRLLPLLFLLLFLVPAAGQEGDEERARELLKERGEVCFSFPRPPDTVWYRLSHLLSVDRLDRDSVRAYAGPSAFRAFLATGLPWHLCPVAGAAKGLTMASGMEEAAAWDSYPTYQQYVALMQGFAAAYPGLCRLDTLGTTPGGHLLLAVKISDHPAVQEDEPVFFYSSTMHGDETGGFVLMLHLIDSLLRGYEGGGQVRRLVDSLEIWINPLANPDGTYHDGDSTVSGATRYNSQGIDLNRNFPDPRDGLHPDGNEYAPETVAMMRFLQQHRPVVSANFHSGAEVVNYPWDTWTSSERTHADNNWFYAISRRYADTVHAHAPAGYMTYLDNGVTNGGDWYAISGGRQDYVTGYLHGREVTIELDNTKLTPVSGLIALWDYNKRSLLNYMEEAVWGLGGYVVDSLTEVPVAATLRVLAHDDTFSLTFSDTLTGYFRRPLAPGTWDLEITAAGYDTALLRGVVTARDSLTWLVIRLGRPTSAVAAPAPPRLLLWPNPVAAGTTIHLRLPHPGTWSLTLTHAAGTTLTLLSRRPLPSREIAVTLPPHLHGLWLLTATSPHTVPLTRKIIIRH